MKYIKEENLGDLTTNKVFEGTPKEILELLEGLDMNKGKENEIEQTITIKPEISVSPSDVAKEVNELKQNMIH